MTGLLLLKQPVLFILVPKIVNCHLKKIYKMRGCQLSANFTLSIGPLFLSHSIQQGIIVPILLLF